MTLDIGKKIKDLRQKHNMTQDELADRLFVTRNAISKWENDKGIPNIDSLKGLAKLFDVSLDYLFGEEEIIKIAIENNRKNEINKNLLYSIVQFLLFSIIGITIPYNFYKVDSESIMVAIIIVLPMAYILLGLLSALSNTNKAYVSISAGLSLVPIYVFFDLIIKQVTFGLWGILYFVIFMGIYLMLEKLLRIKLTKNKSRKLEVIFRALTLVIIAIFFLHTIIGIINLVKYPWNSAPWTVVLVINIFIYIIPFTFFTTLFLYYKKKRLSNLDY